MEIGYPERIEDQASMASNQWELADRMEGERLPQAQRQDLDRAYQSQRVWLPVNRSQLIVQRERLLQFMETGYPERIRDQEQAWLYTNRSQPTIQRKRDCYRHDESKILTECIKDQSEHSILIELGINILAHHMEAS